MGVSAGVRSCRPLTAIPVPEFGAIVRILVPTNRRFLPHGDHHCSPRGSRSERLAPHTPGSVGQFGTLLAGADRSVPQPERERDSTVIEAQVTHSPLRRTIQARLTSGLGRAMKLRNHGLNR